MIYFLDYELNQLQRIKHFFNYQCRLCKTTLYDSSSAENDIAPGSRLDHLYTTVKFDSSRVICNCGEYIGSRINDNIRIMPFYIIPNYCFSYVDQTPLTFTMKFSEMEKLKISNVAYIDSFFDHEHYFEAFCVECNSCLFFHNDKWSYQTSFYVAVCKYSVVSAVTFIELGAKFVCSNCRLKIGFKDHRGRTVFLRKHFRNEYLHTKFFGLSLSMTLTKMGKVVFDRFLEKMVDNNF